MSKSVVISRETNKTTERYWITNQTPSEVKNEKEDFENLISLKKIEMSLADANAFIIYKFNLVDNDELVVEQLNKELNKGQNKLVEIKTLGDFVRHFAYDMSFYCSDSIVKNLLIEASQQTTASKRKDALDKVIQYNAKKTRK